MVGSVIDGILPGPASQCYKCLVRFEAVWPVPDTYTNILGPHSIVLIRNTGFMNNT